ncbi:ABC1 kinase family protein [Halalkalibacter oceani]|uniref:ABC1 kinase family protein n=1 Tax=Halalkalibacter oceani TaxID=1653776 RepID=UPI0033957EBE
MLRRKMRHLSRYQEIATALFHYGFGHIVRDLGLMDQVRRKSGRKPESDASMAKRIRLLLEELGPTFVKLGQVASTRSDLFPPMIISELETLQDHVPSFPFQEVKGIIEAELQASLPACFASFDEQPLAAASIGQVHRATLISGEEVVVKVRRPMIERLIETDLEIIADLLVMAEDRLSWVAQFQLVELFDEFAKVLRQELNFVIEADNTERIRKQSMESGYISAPRIYSDYSTKKVLTQSFIDGVKVTEATKAAGYQPKRIAEQFAKGMFEQMFVHGFFHGDPHPGNVFVTKANKVVLIDFGMVGRLSRRMRQELALLLIGLYKRDTNKVHRALIGMEILREDSDQELIWDDLEQLRIKYATMEISEISLANALQEIFDIAHKHRCLVPSSLTVLLKSILSIERLLATLAPQLRIIDIIEPFGHDLVRERYDPIRAAKQMQEETIDLLRTLRYLPKELQHVIRAARRNELEMKMSISELDQLNHKIDQITNKLSFSIVLLSFSIIMAAVIVGGSLTAEQTILSRLPSLEIGLGIASFLFLWIIWAIVRSGRF